MSTNSLTPESVKVTIVTMNEVYTLQSELVSETVTDFKWLLFRFFIGNVAVTFHFLCSNMFLASSAAKRIIDYIFVEKAI